MCDYTICNSFLNYTIAIGQVKAMIHKKFNVQKFIAITADVPRESHGVHVPRSKNIYLLYLKFCHSQVHWRRVIFKNTASHQKLSFLSTLVCTFQRWIDCHLQRAQ